MGILIVSMLWVGIGLPIARLVLQNMSWVAILLVPVFLVVAWRFLLTESVGWGAVFDLVYSIGAGALTLLLLAVGYFLHALTPKLRTGTLLMAVTLPCVLVALFLSIWQRVPNAPCATHGISFAVGDAIAFATVDGVTHLWRDGVNRQITYSHFSDSRVRKADVRDLCRLSSNGSAPVLVSHFTSHFFQLPDGTSECGFGTGAFCSGFTKDPDARMGSVTLARHVKRVGLE